jgi:type II secretory pathway pseudopilin PulG
MKKIKGITLLESIVSLALIAALVTGAIYFYVEKTKKQNSEIFGLEVLKYIKLVDEKTAMSGFREDQWPKKNSSDFSSFKNFMYNNFNSVGTNCGVNDGWTPIVDRTNTETDQFKERSQSEKEKINEINEKSLVNCEYFNKDAFFMGLNPMTRITEDSDNKYINSVDFIFYYENENDFKDNFIYLKRALDFMKAQDSGDEYGSHYYSFVNLNNLDVDLKPLECFSLKEDCAIKASFRRSGQQDYVRTNGLDSIESGIVTFKVYDYNGTVRKDLIHGITKNCDKWTYNNVSNSWTKTNTYKCGVGLYEGGLVASLLDGTSTSKTIYLDKQCNKYNINTPTNTGPLASVPNSFISEYSTILEKDNKNVPCGIYEEDSEYIVVSNEIHADEVKVGGELNNGSEVSKIEVHPSAEMIAEDYQAKLAYDANPPILSGDEAILNPSKSDFKKPSRTVVERIKDPSLSSTENALKSVSSKNITIYEDLIVNSSSPLPPEEVFTTGELEVLNNFTTTQELDIDNNASLTPSQKNEAKKTLSTSQIKGEAEVSGSLTGGNLVVGNEKLFDYDETKMEYSFKNNPANQAELDDKKSGSPIQIAEKIKDITTQSDIKVTNKSEANSNLSGQTFQFVPNPTVIAGNACPKNGVIGADNVFELFICQDGKWESLIQDGGISAFNSATCPTGWRDYTEADGRSLIGTGYFDTLHAGVVQYKTGETGGKAKHKLTVDEMPSHNHVRPTIQHICAACHHNLGLAKIASGSSYWNRIANTGATGGDQEHENRAPYYAVKFCIKGSDTPFDYIDANVPNPNDIWVEYEPDEGDFTDHGAKYDCYKDTQVDNISDPSDPKTYEVEVCKQDQIKTIKGREMNTRTSAIRYTGLEDYEYRTIITQESWQDYAPFYTECEEKGDLYSCSNWDVEEEDVKYNVNFTQEKSCLRDRVRYKQIRKKNWIGGQIKVVSQTEEACLPPATVVVYNNAVGKRVDEFRTDVDFGTNYKAPLRLELAGSFDINNNASSSDNGAMGIPIKNDDGDTVMIKIRRQERFFGIGFTCSISLYNVKGDQVDNNKNDNGNTFNWIDGFKYLKFYTASDSLIGTVNLGSTNSYANYSYKDSSNDVCSLTNTLYNNINSVKYITIDDI